MPIGFLWHLVHKNITTGGGQLNYLKVKQPDTTFAVSVSQFMVTPRTTHWGAVIRNLGYLKNGPGCGILHDNHAPANISDLARSLLER